MPNAERVAIINTPILRVAKQRLKFASKTQSEQGLGHVTQGMVLSELIMSHLPPSPDEKRAPKKSRAAAGGDDLRAVAS